MIGEVPRATIPTSHADLFARPICAVLTTIDTHGAPQSTLVWVDREGDLIRINTTPRRRKARNVAAQAKVSVLVVDPDDTSRFVQVRGDAELVVDGAAQHLERLCAKYGADAHSLPPDRVVISVRPRRVTTDAIHR